MMEWFKYQLRTFDQWLEYSPAGEFFIWGLPFLILWAFILMNECGVL